MSLSCQAKGGSDDSHPLQCGHSQLLVTMQHPGWKETGPGRMNPEGLPFRGGALSACREKIEKDHENQVDADELQSFKPVGFTIKGNQSDDGN